MQFRYLKFSALGPFPGTHTIDFDELTAGGLFLFDGPTGSGKSSVIDAIVFALYGNVAGKESDDSRIRSSHADDETASYADLVFTIPSGIYRVRRSPSWERKKKRGEGTTVQGARATLWKLSESAVDNRQWDAGDVLASGARDVGIELSKLLALTREQFVQTVVLPQGEFAQFLRLSSSDRSALLETLFDTSDYRRFTQLLGERARTAKKFVEDAGATATRALHAWCDIDGLTTEFPEVASLEFIDADDTAPLTAMATIDEELSAREARASAKAAELETELDTRRVARRSEEELAKALEDRARLLARQAELDSKSGEIAGHKERISLHEKVATAVDRLGTAEQARKALDSATRGIPDGVERVEDERLELVRAIDDGRDVAQPAEKLVGAIAEATGEVTARIGSLESLVALEQGLGGRKKSADRLEEEYRKLSSDISRMESDVESFPERLDSLDSDIAKAREEADTAPTLEAKVKEIQSQLDKVKKVDSLRQEFARAQDDGQAALDKHKAQLDRVRVVTDAWRRSTAANLAANLRDEEPCPVCGALDHPAPAQPTDDEAKLDDVQRAEKALEPLQRELDKANEKVQNLKGQIAALESQVGQASHEQLSKSLTEANTALTSARSAKKNESNLSGERAKLVAANDRRRSQLSAKREELSSLAERIKNAREALAKDEESLASARGEASSVSAVDQALRHERSQLANLRSSAETIAERARQVNSTRTAANEALDAAGVSASDARAAHLEESVLATLRKNVEQHGQDVAAVKAQLADPRFTDLTGEEKPDVARAKEKEAQAQESLRAAQREHTLAKSRAQSSRTHLGRTRTALAEWVKAHEAAGPVVRLSNLADADNLSLSKIRLSTWVLLRRFEQIVDRANEHLREFSFGRYELARADESGFERKTGLGLEIIHHDAGPQGDHRRSPRTLSGGETFYTSLALALALSEVVQAENGGIRMETLIIDEGFGALSSEYLQTIMDTLGQLRTGGRTVGIVSHVDELKSMINDRVSVRPLGSGGSTLTVVAGS